MPPRSPALRFAIRLGALAFVWQGCSDAGDGPSADDTSAVAARPNLTVEVTGGAAPVAGAWVTLAPGGRDARADADGRATFAALVPGAYVATVAAAGFQPAQVDADVADDTSLSVTLTAIPADAGVVRGVVRGPGSAAPPLEGVGVEVDGVVLGTSAPDGSFAVSGVPAGAHRVRLVPPAGSALLPWTSAALEVPAYQGVVLSAVLPGGPPADAAFVGSAACTECHADAAAAHAGSAHARAGRTPAEVEDEGPAELVWWFEEGAYLRLPDSDLSVALERRGPGDWRARVLNAPASVFTEEWPVVEVYGGRAAGAAFALDADGTRLVLPVAWLPEREGLPADAASHGMTLAWPAGWVDARGALSLDADGLPGAAAQWDLSCGGCHATGHRLTHADGRYTLASIDGVMERQVGCESCHGAGEAHVAAARADGDAAGFIHDPTDLPAAERLDACGRCHTRTESLAQPFADPVPWPVDAEGRGVGPTTPLAAVATATPTRWEGLPLSRLHRDQGGDYADSPHHGGPGAYDGACEDCHAPHGSAAPAALRADPLDRALCVTCHAAAFPDEAADAGHAAHRTYHPGPWSPGACTGCHFPRGPVALRTDGNSGAGDLRSHGLRAWSPALSAETFDALGATELPLGEAPISACLDCHLQADAQANAEGTACPCPADDATARQTHLDLGEIWDVLFGADR